MDMKFPSNSHLMVILRRTNGVIFVHQNRKYGTYHYFASQLVKMRPELKNVSAFGTDGEEALYSAFSSVFPKSIHLLCQIHKRDNITRKLRCMKASEDVAKQILADIFGSTNGETRYAGLIDSPDNSNFNSSLNMLEPKWNSFCPSFFNWFVANESDLFCSSMIASVRSMAGLGHPPKYYTTNNNESMNCLLKHETLKFKKHEWPTFN